MAIKIIVMMKQVPDAEEIFIDPVKFTLNRAQARGIINPSDENALECALKIKDQTGAEITVLSMGPPAAESAIIECMGRGADRGVLVTDRVFAAADTYATSLTLAASVKNLGEFDLIIAGESTTDSGTGHVGPGVAEFLGIDQATYCTSLHIENDALVAERDLEDGTEVVSIGLPALATVLISSNIPRRAKLRLKIDALRKGIEKWDHDTLKLPPEWVGIKGSPTVVGALKIPEERKRAAKRITVDQLGELVKELGGMGLIKTEEEEA
ncbi:MAG: electron transfer flavoprotein subunit beta/FixA family protein [Candidatus Thermoplasmatota archaeon]|jgi:electron transfer flavoprotein beta subunit|nr:electron transfer flavoprotein subunit beta/FixA family protein [Candidatus Thermoplasmatota archaeon]MCL5785238.1 electron transfer flavoprotein subunit beta/FixA family protein [Candidatus Thermoplasmatota archaeon]